MRLLRSIRACLAIALSLTVCVIAGCASSAMTPAVLATRLQMHAVLLKGTDFVHSSYVRVAASDSRRILWVFIEGDGRPWIRGGSEPARDPTTRNAIALRLASLTQQPVLYVGRPCYDGHARDAGCRVELWTSHRYSATVVASMAQAIRSFLQQHEFADVVLIGHSGGGTLATLIAPQLPGVRALVTIAANLDVEAWTETLNYLPLEGSLNPSTLSIALPPLQIHLLGARDTVVPPFTTQRFFARHPNAQQWEYAEFDHRCCWEEAWPQIQAQIESLLMDTQQTSTIAGE